jgi:c(7)-type cytochrome triheme protein
MPPIVLYVFIILFLIPASASSQVSSSQYSQEIPAPQYYGKVILNNYARKAGMDPVVFDHWLHRAKFTCRICHIDIGFAMEAKATGISAVDNINGYYCGSCHDGKRVIEDKAIFAACAVKYSEEEGKRCARCHSKALTGQGEYDYSTFTENLPRLQKKIIDWEKAEAEGKIKPIDSLEGISYKRAALKAQRDFSIEVSSWKSDVIFSHKKHTVWNGCEVCHPLIFSSSKKGTVQYSMFEIMEGEYCGVCHLSVAFPVWFCYKCHKDPVQ